jgi:NAD(P)-dependent dehydrogenase (short-subunit alcohol dehydrogenase family)
MTRPRRRILITGGTDGIGRALTKRLASRHDLIVTGRRERSSIPDLPENVSYVPADQRDPEKAARAIAQGLLMAGWTKLDNAVLNAATGYARTPGEETLDLIRETFDVNLAANILQARTLYSWLKKAQGTLTLVGSVAHRGAPSFASYAATKAGLDGLARALREEWRGEVNVQILHPGPTATSMHAKAGHDPGKLARWFIGEDSMAAMIERAISGGMSPRVLGWRRLIGGGAVLGRSL